ncbi:hypothetical protein [Granulicella mallensis]|uniref:Uncharacterized protein n=1 Tax=Granulicella mallensis (strain ATCC BAA-1857 / DSM 23137 / MP5ACTX8) TaxID=682795 RepID=G8NYS2_GRAMM|nr:hypothetical protein [Granulicella mallensis]AEU34485.1 hypothetical protein AciX8_0127 [Granulicella mallensis MP5ACTX8]
MTFVSRLEPMMAFLLKGLLSALDEEEREAVAGDLLEAHESPLASVLQVLGLVLRRQLNHWARWQPWLVFIAVVTPLAVVLSQTAREFAGWAAVYSWMLINNTDATLLRTPGFWHGALEYGGAIVKFGLVLFCCSWVCGRLIAKLSRHTRLSMGLLLLVISLLVNIIGIPSHARAFLIHANDRYFPNGPVFALAFYRTWFPLILFVLTVLIPFLLAMIPTKTSIRESKPVSILLSCSTVFVTVGLMEQPWLLREIWSWQIIPAPWVHLPYLLPFASIGPACYLLWRFGQRSCNNFSPRARRLPKRAGPA